jgi:putative transposase
MTTAVRSRYAGYRFPAEIISHAVWLYFRFPLGLRMVEEMLAARGIVVSHDRAAKQIDGRQWSRKFGQAFANRIRRRLPFAGDKWHVDEVVLKIAGVTHRLWRAVDQLDVLVQSRRDKGAAKRLLRKLLRRQGRAPRVMITDKLASYGTAKLEVMPGVELVGTRAWTTGRRTRISRRGVENDRRSASSRPARRSGSCQPTIPSTTYFTFAGSTSPLLSIERRGCAP